MKAGKAYAAVALVATTLMLAPPALAAPAAVPQSSAGNASPPVTPARALPLQAAQVQRLDDALAAALDDLPGGITAGVWVPGRRPWVRSVGEADLTTHQPMRANLQQPVGSVTKTFTGTLVMQQVARGAIGLDDRLARWYPEVPKADEITVAMLLNMSSGIADYANARIEALLAEMAENPRRTYDPDDLIAVGVALPRVFDVPGETFAYSNTNTLLLGRILEKVTGTSYARLLDEHLLGPLGMDRSRLFVDGTLDAPHAQTYTELLRETETDPLTSTTDWLISWGWSAGALASTVADLADWGKALGTGEGVLDRRTQRERLQHCSPARVDPAATTRTEYCLGVVAVRDVATGIARTLWHNGAVFGAVSYVGYYPLTGAVVAVVANTDVSDEHDQNLAMRTKAGIEAAVPGLLGLLPTQTRRAR